MEYTLKKSNKKDKRFLLEGNGKKIHFGQKNPKDGTYIDHKDAQKKNNYIKRHSKNENWNAINAGSLSRFLLWEKPTLEQAVKKYEKKFNVKINNLL